MLVVNSNGRLQEIDIKYKYGVFSYGKGQSLDTIEDMSPLLYSTFPEVTDDACMEYIAERLDNNETIVIRNVQVADVM